MNTEIGCFEMTLLPMNYCTLDDRGCADASMYVCAGNL